MFPRLFHPPDFCGTMMKIPSYAENEVSIMVHAMTNKSTSKRTKIYLAISIPLLLLTALCYGLAKYHPELMFPWYRDASQKVLQLWANVTDLVPFSILEFLILGLIWLAIGWLIKVIAARGRGLVHLLTTALLIGSVMISMFVLLWGACQFAPTFAEEQGYDTTSYTPEEAAEAAAYYLQMANQYALSSPRDENGVTDFGSFFEIAGHVESGYEALAQKYGSRFDVGNVTPKPMLFSWVMDCIGLTGLFTAYTGEMSINCNTPDVSLPFTISHECAHRAAVAHENDANFVAFLACIGSEDIAYQYSGYYSAFIYVYNAISKVSKDTQSQLWSGLSDSLKADILASNAHYAQFAGPVKDKAQKVNDKYLKSFGQPSGVNNYGAVAGALIGYYWKEIKPELG